MNLQKLWNTLDKRRAAAGKLEEYEVKQFLAVHSPKTLEAIGKTECGQASRDEIRKASQFFLYYMDHRSYEAVIHSYDSTIQLPKINHSQSNFVGKGGGGSSFASYRKVMLEEKKVYAFEKI